MFCDVVRSYGWLTDKALTYMIAVSESTPGPIVRQPRYICGKQLGRFLGSHCRKVGSCPAVLCENPFVMIALQNLLKNKYVQAILHYWHHPRNRLNMVINKCAPLVRSTSFEVYSKIRHKLLRKKTI